MSLILEALRKSEAERRRGERPSLHGELPPSIPTSRARIAPGARLTAAAIAALGIGWGVYAWWTRTSAADLPSHTVPVARTLPVSTPTARLPPVKHLTPPAVIAPSPRAVVPPVPAPSAPLRQPPVEASTTVPVPLPVPMPIPASGDRTLHLSDLDPEQRKSLPPLKLSMHMWNDDPTQRFVILDGSRLREGDRIGDAVVTAITREGVVVDWEGRRLLVPIR
ncbi:MAG: general secretion pathway protein GspB [Luteimonas sp.]